MENEIEKTIVYIYYDYLNKHHKGIKNAISREELCKVFNVSLKTQKRVLARINSCQSFDKLVSTSECIYVCDTMQESKKAYVNEINSGLTRIKKGVIMARKVLTNEQFKMQFSENYKPFKGEK